jgi:hypothetical protein
MLKEVLVVGGSAAVGGWLTTKYGGKIQPYFISLGLPASAANVVVVGGSAALVYFVVRAVM